MSSQRGFISKFFRFVIVGLWFLVRLFAVIWAALAIYYSNLPWAELRLGLAARATGARPGRKWTGGRGQA